MKKIKGMFMVVMVIISCVYFCVIASANNSDTADPISTVINNDYDAVLNIDYRSVLSSDSLVSVLANDIENMYEIDLEDIVSTNNIPITTAVSYNREFTYGEAMGYLNDLNALIELYESLYDSNIIADNERVTNKYNCHAYAWYGAPNNGLCWIKNPYQFIEDPHCDKISNNIYDDNVQEGDIVYFYNGDEYTGEDPLNHTAVHSSIVYSIDYDNGQKIVTLISKFGAYGVYRHLFEATSFFYSDYDNYTVYRYVQNEHQNSYITLSSVQHHTYCGVDGCSYNEYHDTIITSVNSNRHRLSCAECDYSVYEDHDLYLHTAEPGDYVVKCRDCSYTIECSEDPEFIDGDETGHWVDCTCGCYSFFEEHSYNYHWLPPSNSNRLFYHRAVCSVCTGTHNLPHNWVAAELGGGVVCSDCGLESNIGGVGNVMSLSDEELSLLLSSMSVEELEQFIASLPEDAVARVTAILPPDDEHLTE